MRGTRKIVTYGYLAGRVLVHWFSSPVDDDRSCPITRYYPGPTAIMEFPPLNHLSWMAVNDGIGPAPQLRVGSPLVNIDIDSRAEDQSRIPVSVVAEH